MILLDLKSSCLLALQIKKCNSFSRGVCQALWEISKLFPKNKWFIALHHMLTPIKSWILRNSAYGLYVNFTFVVVAMMQRSFGDCSWSWEIERVFVFFQFAHHNHDSRCINCWWVYVCLVIILSDCECVNQNSVCLIMELIDFRLKRNKILLHPYTLKKDGRCPVIRTPVVHTYTNKMQIIQLK